MLNDTLADALTTIKNAERVGKRECMIKPASKMIGRVLKVLQENDYIESFEWINDGKGGIFRVKTKGNINDCNVIKPRYSVSKDEFEKWEARYLPAEGFGVIVISTSEGIISHYEAKNKGIGGKLIAYVY
ncbi:MAG: 30S ribosomal protein S8 [Candidatus Thermoplasmatota archaeon]